MSKLEDYIEFKNIEEMREYLNRPIYTEYDLYKNHEIEKEYMRNEK